MKHLILLVAALAMCVTGVAWGDVIVVNSIGEPDSNRPGEDLPEWWETDGDDLAVDTTDTGGGASTASMTFANCTEGAVYNDHYEDPIDISCCFTYFNFYVKSSVEVAWLGGWGSSNDWSEEFGLPELQDQVVVGEWTYISVHVDDMTLEGFIPEDYDTNGLNFDLAEEGQIWFDHWTFSDTPEEGTLDGAEEGEPAAEGEIDYPPPVTEGAPVAGMLGLGLVAAACALGGAMTLRKK